MVKLEMQDCPPGRRNGAAAGDRGGGSEMFPVGVTEKTKAKADADADADIRGLSGDISDEHG